MNKILQVAGVLKQDRTIEFILGLKLLLYYRRDFPFGIKRTAG